MKTLRQRIHPTGINCIPWRYYKGEIRELPVSAQCLFRWGGISLDVWEITLEEEGYLHPGENLLDVLRTEKGLKRKPEPERGEGESYPEDWETEDFVAYFKGGRKMDSHPTDHLFLDSMKRLWDKQDALHHPLVKSFFRPVVKKEMKESFDPIEKEREKSFTTLMKSYKKAVEVEKKVKKFPFYIPIIPSDDFLAFQKAKEENSDELIGCHCYFDLQGRKIRGAGVITNLYEKTVHIKTKLGTFIRKWETHRIRAYPKYVKIKGV